MTIRVLLSILLAVVLSSSAPAQTREAWSVEIFCEAARSELQNLVRSGARESRVAYLAFELVHLRPDPQNLALMQAVLETEPVKDEWWQFDRATMYWFLGNTTEAEHILKQLETNEQMRGFVDGARLAFTGRIPAARENDAGWIEHHASAALMLGNPDAYKLAVDRYRRLAEQEAGNERSRALFSLLLRGNDFEGASAVARGFHAAWQRIDRLTSVAYEMQDAGDLASARAIVTEASKLPGDQAALVGSLSGLAAAAWDVELPDLAKEITGRAVALAPDPNDYGRLLGLCERAGERVDLAALEKGIPQKLAELEKLFSKDELKDRGGLIADTIASEGRQRLLGLAIAYAWRGDMDNAKRAFGMVEGGASNADSADLPLVLAEKGSIREAVALAYELLDVETGDFALDLIVYTAVRQGRFDDALWCLTQYRGDHPPKRPVFRTSVYLARAGRGGDLKKLAESAATPELKASVYLLAAKEMQGTARLGLLGRMW